MKSKILVLSFITPNEFNKNGPSGVLYEVIRYLDNLLDIDFVVLPEKRGVSRIFRDYGVYIKKSTVDFSLYTHILVYPNVVILSVPKSYWHKVVMLGPDSSSLLFARFLKISDGTRWLKYKIRYYFALRFEKQIVKKVKYSVVVGREDVLWQKHVCNQYFNNRNIVFLRHPLLTSNLISELHLCLSDDKRFIFSGDLSKHYVGHYISNIVEFLRGKISFCNRKMNILVIGKNNYWVYKEFKSVDGISLSYIEWIDDYRDVCCMGRDIHCVPLVTGAGTKNRVLSAVANAVEVITTNIGIESILYTKETREYIHVVNTPEDFVKCMLLCHNSHDLSEANLDKRIEAAKCFRDRTTLEFKNTLDYIFCGDAKNVAENKETDK